MAGTDAGISTLTNPVINAPYEQPMVHFELGPDGTPTGTLVPGRRPRESFIPVPVSRKGKAAQIAPGQPRRRSGVPRPPHQRWYWVVVGVMVAVVAGAGCSGGGSHDPDSQTEEQVLNGYRAHRSDIWVSAAVTVTSETTRLVRVHVANTGVGGDVDDVRVRLAVDGSAGVVLALPDTCPIPAGVDCCSNSAVIECRVGWLGSPPVGDNTQDQPSFVDLEFTFDVGGNPEAVPSTLTVTVDSSIHGDIEERRVDETPEDNTVTVEL